MKRWSWRRFAVGVFGCAASVAIALVLSLLHRVYLDRSALPDLEAFIRFEPPSTGGVYDADGQLLLELAREYRQIVSFDEIPPIVRQAVLAAEDKNFFSHSGIDYTALPRVVWRNVRNIVDALRTRGAPPDVFFVQGGSTITQQLVRGYFLTDLTREENGSILVSRTPTAYLLAAVLGVRATNKLVRKIEEARLSLWLEAALRARVGSRQHAKEMIFARYASLIYLGHGRYGLAAASQYYFDKPIQSYTDADADEAALLAAAIKSPRHYAPSGKTIERALQRRNAILALMAENKFLSAEHAARSQGEPIELTSRGENESETTAPGFVAHVFEELRQNVGGYGLEDLVHGKIRVHTTMDPRVQRIADDAVEHGLAEYERRHRRRAGQVQAALVVLRNADGRILAEVGGRRVYNDRERRYTDFNRAIQSLRQPGSALKPLVYLAAFRQGYTLESPVIDDPIAIPEVSGAEFKLIANYDGTFKGAITIRQALAESRNAATVWTAREVGMSAILQTARDVGMGRTLRPYLSTALGASEVTLLELANIYRTLASGIIATPHVVTALTDRHGNTTYTAPDVTRRADIPELPLIQEALRGVVRLPGGTGRALNSGSFRLPVLGKTGTSNDFRDALFVGSTYGPSGMTVAVWVGHDNGESLGSEETGGRVALPIFREVMTKIYRAGDGGAVPQFPWSIEYGIDTYLAQASVLAERADPVVVPSESWTQKLSAGALALAARFASFVPGMATSDAPDTPPPPQSIRQRSTNGRAWACRRMAAGVACVDEAAAATRRSVRTRPAPDRRPRWR